MRQNRRFWTVGKLTIRRSFSGDPAAQSFDGCQ
jgi:hypothetical protein